MNKNETFIFLMDKHRGDIGIILTPEQEKKLYPLSEIEGIWSLGFVPPSQINSYFCLNCDKKFYNNMQVHNMQVPPKVRVSVERFNSGDLNTTVRYHCSDCDKVVYKSLLPSPEGIPEEFIEYDETGEYKRPTVESVNSLLDRIENQAKEGIGESVNQPNYFRDLKTAERWAKKIDYDINPEVENLEKVFRKSYIGKLEQELPLVVSNIMNNVYGFNLVERDHISPYEGAELPKKMHKLFEAIELINPKDIQLNNNILKILELYGRMIYEEKERLSEERRSLEERIYHEENSLVKANKLRNDFIQKVNMSNEQVDEARENPLDSD
jgi:hypothetical protein